MDRRRWSPLPVNSGTKPDPDSQTLSSRRILYNRPVRSVILGSASCSRLGGSGFVGNARMQGDADRIGMKEHAIESLRCTAYWLTEGVSTPGTFVNTSMYPFPNSIPTWSFAQIYTSYAPYVHQHPCPRGLVGCLAASCVNPWVVAPGVGGGQGSIPGVLMALHRRSVRSGQRGRQKACLRSAMDSQRRYLRGSSVWMNSGRT